MVSAPAQPEPAAPRQPFTFYACDGRILASNAEQKLIDLGALTQQGTSFGYLLHGSQESAGGLASPQAALRHLADHVRFLYLDGQFTAVADLRGSGSVHLHGAPRIEVMIDEFRSSERAQDATV